MNRMSTTSRANTAVQRRTSMPQELEDPDDLTVSDPDVDRYKVLEIITTADDDARDSAGAGHGSSMSQLTDGNSHAEGWTSGAAAARAEADTFVAAVQDQLLRLPKEIRNIIAGGVAGMVAKSVVAPLDRIKILYQVTSAEFRIRNIPTVVRNIVVNEGWAALWKGNIATLLRVFPYAGVQFMVFDWIKMWQLRQHEIIDSSPEPIHVGSPPFASPSSSSPSPSPGTPHHSRKFGLTPMESLVAGMIAGTVSVVCTYPLDLTRAQLAVLRRHKHPAPHHLPSSSSSTSQSARTKSFARVVRDNYRRGGIPGLFRGMPVTLFGILPYSGIAFALNEQGKREIQYMTGRDVTTMERLQCGAVAGLFAQTLTYPIEVTRRRMQTLGLVGNDTAFGNVGVSGGAAVAEAQQRPPNLAQTIRVLYAEQGVRGFFKGVSVNWAKGPIAFGISFTMFDTVQHFLETPAERSLRLPRGL